MRSFPPTNLHHCRWTLLPALRCPLVFSASTAPASFFFLPRFIFTLPPRIFTSVGIRLYFLILLFTSVSFFSRDSKKDVCLLSLPFYTQTNKHSDNTISLSCYPSIAGSRRLITFQPNHRPQLNPPKKLQLDAFYRLLRSVYVHYENE